MGPARGITPCLCGLGLALMGCSPREVTTTPTPEGPPTNVPAGDTGDTSTVISFSFVPAFWGLAGASFAIDATTGQARSATGYTDAGDTVELLPTLVIYLADASAAQGPTESNTCVVVLQHDGTIDPVEGRWVESGGALAGYEFPATATVDDSDCTGKITEPGWENLGADLLRFTWGVGIQPEVDQEAADLFKQLYSAEEYAQGIEPYAVGAGFYSSLIELPEVPDGYWASGFTFGTPVDASFTWQLDATGNVARLTKEEIAAGPTSTGTDTGADTGTLPGSAVSVPTGYYDLIPLALYDGAGVLVQ